MIGKIKRRPKYIATFIAALVFIILAFLGFAQLGRPAVGTVSNQTQSQDAATAPVTQVQAKGKYASFNYPSNFSVLSAPKPSGNVLETFAYAKKPFPFWFLNAEVAKLPSGNLVDEGSYNLRIKDTARYRYSSVSINGQTINTFFDSSEGYAKVAFVPHGQMLFTLSLNSSDTPNADKLNQIFTDVLKSLQWL
jgi:hypothetical protein